MNAGGRAMKAREWLIGAAVCLVATAGGAQAGKNAGGYLVLYTNDSVVFSSGTSYADSSGVTCPSDANCPANPANNCSAKKAVVQDGHSSTKTDAAVVWWLIAGWPEEACPKLKALTFGINYTLHVDGTTAGLVIADSGTDADFEVKTSNWPSSNSGTGITWDSAKTSRLREVYWFAGYVYSDPTTFHIRSHPTQGGPEFGDDNIPAGQDPAGVGYGGDPNQNFLPTLGLAGSVEGSNGDITATQQTTWGGIKSHYGVN